ncbi:MAG: PPOX class F420-dependent oxidoreductase [Actinomycetota bacterium]|jgi:PPOX class probable F420-dependent enzyme|nr:PPOX class F420-dependent oxidoreductase [Actinomycetota bacterium]
MELQEGLDFARSRRQGVLVTRRADGRPQLSNILYHLSDSPGGGAGGGGAGGDASGGGGGPVVRISVTDSRAKTRNMRRDPAASLYVPGESFWAYVVLDGTAELSPVASASDDDTVEELVELYRSISGRDHPDWAEYRESMVAERRLVARLHPTHAYGLLAR